MKSLMFWYFTAMYYLHARKHRTLVWFQNATEMYGERFEIVYLRLILSPCALVYLFRQAHDMLQNIESHRLFAISHEMACERISFHMQTSFLTLFNIYQIVKPFAFRILGSNCNKEVWPRLISWSMANVIHFQTQANVSIYLLQFHTNTICSF